MEQNFAQVFIGEDKPCAAGGIDLIFQIMKEEPHLFLGQFVHNVNDDVEQRLNARFPNIHFEFFSEQNGISAFDAVNAGYERIKEVLLSGDYGVVMVDGADFAVAQHLLTPLQLRDIVEASTDDTRLLLIDRFQFCRQFTKVERADLFQ